MPMAIAAIATGIMLKVMDSPMGMGILTNARTIKTATSMASSVIRATFVRFAVSFISFLRSGSRGMPVEI